MRKFVVEEGPYIKANDEHLRNSQQNMLFFSIALIPICLFGWIINGIVPLIYKIDNFSFINMLTPLLNIIVGILSSVLFEGIYFFFFLKVKDFKMLINKIINNYGVVISVILTILLPPFVPFYVIIFGSFISNIVFKMLFGGYGYSIFNPSLLGYVICVLAFNSIVMNSGNYQIEILNKLFDTTFNSSIDMLIGGNGKILPYAFLKEHYGGLLKMFLGLKTGCIGGMSPFICTIAFVFLLANRVINWRTPVHYLATIFVLTWIVGIMLGVEGGCFGIWYPTYSILAGPTMFCGIMVATEPITTPEMPNGKIIYAIAAGILTIMIRYIRGIDGTITSILFMCLFTPLINRFAAINRGHEINSKMIFNYLIILAIFIVCIVYMFYRIKYIY